MTNPFEKSSKIKKVLKVLKVIFLTKFPMNFLFLIIVAGLSIYGFDYLMPEGTPTGDVVLQQECPECVCEEEECEPDCDLCPIKTKIETKETIKYECNDGDIVTDLDDCTADFPDVDEDYSGTVEGVTLAIDNIEYEKDDEDSGFVTRVDYTIINKGDIPIVPKVEVKVYEEWTLKVSKTVANKELIPEVVLKPNEYIQRKDRVRIYFNGEEQTVRLLLVNRLQRIEQDVIAVTRDFDLDYAG